MTARVTVSALRLAAEWVEAYDADGEDDPAAVSAELAAVAEFLRTEADRRDRDALVRSVARQAAEVMGRKATDPVVVAAARRAIATSARS